MGTISRRAFITGSAVLGASVLTGGILSGCSSQTPSESQEQDQSQPNEQTQTQTNEQNANAVLVYFTSDISSAGLLQIWNSLGLEAPENTAVKLSTGEPGGNNYLHPDLIEDLIHEVDGTIVECNTAYGGSRSTTESHLQAAADHGFTAIANVDIMDADGSLSLPIEGGSHLSEDLVGDHLANYNYVISLAHFKGHTMAGFGGAIKNCSIGIASREGKC